MSRHVFEKKYCGFCDRPETETHSLWWLWDSNGRCARYGPVPSTGYESVELGLQSEEKKDEDRRSEF